MDKEQKICENLIKIANQFDIEGEHDLANEMTKVAESVANNTKVAFLGRSLFNMLGRGRGGGGNIVQMAYMSGDTNLYQKATQLQQQQMQLTASMQQLRQEIQTAMQNRAKGQQPALAAQPTAPVVATPAAPAPAQPVPAPQAATVPPAPTR